MRPVLPALLLLACTSDILVSEKARCDGQLQPAEETVDQPFDLDRDGYFDVANPDCLTVYPLTLLDCNDGDPNIHPGAAEAACTGVDEDCNEATLDAEDSDGDGVTACDDCADNDPGRLPGAAELSCDGVDNDCDDSTPDAVDVDLDGASSCADCDDADPSRSPTVDELLCNGVDDDCNPDTPDEIDADNDTIPSCTDCDDGDSTILPGADELCENGVDDNCNGEIDESCDVSYTDTWTLDSRISYSCAWGFVAINFNRLNVFDARPDITLASATGSQPGTLFGSFTGATTFSVTHSLLGTCDEIYTIDGSFPTETTMEGVLDVQFVGSCLDCSAQSFPFTASR